MLRVHPLLMQRGSAFRSETLYRPCPGRGLLPPLPHASCSHLYILHHALQNTTGRFPHSGSDDYCMKLYFEREGFLSELAGTKRIWPLREEYPDNVAGAVAVLDMEQEDGDDGSLARLCSSVLIHSAYIPTVSGAVWLQRCAGGSLIDAVQGNQ